ncbi:MAG: maleylpyruvate isomerase family mycothiol-dependent enzyme [Acidimicrobiales bacterium]
MTPDLPATLRTIERDGELLIATCEANPQAAIRHCPGWTATDLALHTTGVHRRVAHWCAERVSEPCRWPDHEPADPSTPGEWCREGLRLVTAALAGIGPDEPVWSWTDRRNGGFYHRRMLHETVLHRWDAQDAVGVSGHIDADIAHDGIDEVIDVGLRYRGDGSPIDYPDGDVVLEQAGSRSRWRLRAVDGTLLVARDADAGAAAAATVHGTAEDLLLYLWGRSGHVTVTGDVEVATAWSAVAP